MELVVDEIETAIQVEDLSKCFFTYAKPSRRLLQSIVPRLQTWVGVKRREFHSEFWALRGVSFTVRQGEVVGIVGRNGSGKSTLLQTLCGTLTPTSGIYRSRGRIAALLELGSGFNPEYTGRENVYLNAAIVGLAREEVDTKFDEIVAFADIGEFLDRPVKTYSSGMVVRLAFAVAINVDPDILVVDEALAVGDELFQRKCFARIDELKRRGVTILFVSHSGATIIDLCDRALLMDSGQLLADGSPKSVMRKYHQLLYAPIDKFDAIRNEILQEAEANDSAEEGAAEVHSTVVEELETYDPAFLSKNAVAYEPAGAIISGVQLETLSGRAVNGLVRGRTYQLRYQVLFTERVRHARFAMMIKSLKGVHLGGALSAGAIGDAPDYQPGTVVDVVYRFKCSVNPAVYFLNVGVFGILKDEETVLHRIVDAVVFRVLPIIGNASQEIFDFECVAQLEKR